MLELKESGLYCEQGDFYIDPIKPVEKAVITHAHADHAVEGSDQLIAHPATIAILNARWKNEITNATPLKYSEQGRLGSVSISLHPAGHVLGSAQIRMESKGEVWLVTGDYKRDADPSCEAFEVVPCDVMVTEATFGLPIFKWKSTRDIAREILDWAKIRSAEHEAVVLYAYSLGKTQRLIAELHRQGHERFLIHRGAEKICQIYRDFGVKLPHCEYFSAEDKLEDLKGRILIMPPGLQKSKLMRRHRQLPQAFVSGWMNLRGARRRRGLAQGFVMSDHADWPSLIKTIKQSNPQKLFVTHGYSDTLARYINENTDIDAEELLVLRAETEEAGG